MSYEKQTFTDGTTVLKAEHLNHIEDGIAANEMYANLKGKKVSLLADSITTYRGYNPSGYAVYYPTFDITSVDKTWWKQFVDITGLELLVNGAWSGSAVSKPRQGSAPACNATRINALASNGVKPDIILTFIGINDFSEDIEVGEWNGGVLPKQLGDSGYYNSFSEAYALMVANLMTTYPDAEIFCCTILDATTFGGSQYDSVDPGVYPTAFNNDAGGITTVQDYNTAIRHVAESLGANVLDMHACGITYFNATSTLGDGLHPNAKGAKLMAEKAAIEVASKSRFASKASAS